MTTVGVSPGTAAITVAELEAAAESVGPQGVYKGAQDTVDVVSEKDALLLIDKRREQGCMKTPKRSGMMI